MPSILWGKIGVPLGRVESGLTCLLIASPPHGSRRENVAGRERVHFLLRGLRQVSWTRKADEATTVELLKQIA